MDVIANLTRVDTKKKFDDIFTKYYSFINADTMITVAHVVDNSGKIALAKPYLISRITDELLKLEKISTKPRLTHECKNILFGKAIIAFDQYFDQIEKSKEVISFIKKQLKNTRATTKIKAEKFMKKREIKP
jgi:predicted acetyltransferase